MVRLCMLRDDPDESTDQYYQKMIKHNPGNALLLGNYARYLKEVRKCYEYDNDNRKANFILFFRSGYR